MEGLPRSHEGDVMQFCVIAIETAAKKMGISPAEFTQRLEKQGLIDGRLIRSQNRLFCRNEGLYSLSKDYEGYYATC